MNWLRQGLLLLWVSPNSLIGLSVGTVGLVTGGRIQIRLNCLEFYGGFVSWILGRIPPNGVQAMTLGHTIIGKSADALAISRDHEQVHVKQYERWGPMFLPAYLACSTYLWILKRDCYRENPFEVEAYSKADPANPGCRTEK